MPDNTIISRLINANHTAQVWSTISTVPKLGEICLETDTGKMKVGDGTKTYAQLPYFNEGFNTITDGTNTIVINGGSLTLAKGGGISYTFNDTNDTLTISSTDSVTTVESGVSGQDVGTLKVTKDGTVSYPKVYGLGTMAGENKNNYLALAGGTMTGTLTLNGAPSSDNDASNKKYVDDKIKDIPKFNIFKGTLGTGGTITTLPIASASNVGEEYKVITDGTYASIPAKVGDMFISSNPSTDVYEWVLIPSGDEPVGTVTNISTGTGLSGGPITSSGTISHADTSSQASITSTVLKYVDSLTLDGMGHVTGATVSTIQSLSGSQDGIVAHYTGSGTKTDYFLNANGEWATPPVSTDIYHKTGTWSGTTYTATKVGSTSSADDLSFTLPDIGIGTKGVLSIVNTTATGGISASISSGAVTLSHSNSITAKTSEGFMSFKYDANGHITGATTITIIDGNFT